MVQGQGMVVPKKSCHQNMEIPFPLELNVQILLSALEFLVAAAVLKTSCCLFESRQLVGFARAGFWAWCFQKKSSQDPWKDGNSHWSGQQHSSLDYEWSPLNDLIGKSMTWCILFCLFVAMTIKFRMTDTWGHSMGSHDEHSILKVLKIDHQVFDLWSCVEWLLRNSEEIILRSNSVALHSTFFTRSLKNFAAVTLFLLLTFISDAKEDHIA